MIFDLTLRIEKIIKRKKSLLLKKSIREGKAVGKITSDLFIEKVRRASKKIHEMKIDYVLQSAKHHIEQNLTQDPHIFVGMTLKLLKNIAEHTDVELTVHPDDALVIKEYFNEIMQACASVRKISIMEDESLCPGSIIIKANKSIVDAQIKTQLDKAKDVLLANIENKNGDVYQAKNYAI